MLSPVWYCWWGVTLATVKAFPDRSPIPSIFLYSIFRDPVPGRGFLLHAVHKATPIQWYILFCFFYSHYPFCVLLDLYCYPMHENTWGDIPTLHRGLLALIDFLLAWKTRKSHKSTDSGKRGAAMGIGPKWEAAQSEDRELSWEICQGTRARKGWATHLTLKFMHWHYPCLPSW